MGFLQWFLASKLEARKRKFPPPIAARLCKETKRPCIREPPILLIGGLFSCMQFLIWFNLLRPSWLPVGYFACIACRVWFCVYRSFSKIGFNSFSGSSEGWNRLSDIVSRALLCPLRQMRRCSQSIGAALKWWRSPQVRLLYQKSFRAKQTNLSEASRYNGIAPFPFRKLTMDWIAGFPVFRPFFPALPVYRKTSGSALDSQNLFPSLVRLYDSTSPRACQAQF